jgi:hypothetical protein
MEKIHWKLILIFAFLNISDSLFSQGINQDINTITIKGISFKQVVTHLMNNGYTIEHLDSKAETVSTKYSKCPSTNDLVNYSINIRVQDSVAEIKGKLCYNIKSNKENAPDSSNSMPAKYTYGVSKAAFLQVDKFAKTFKSEIIYSKTE